MADALSMMLRVSLCLAFLVALLALMAVSIRRVVRAYVGDKGIDVPATLFLFFIGMLISACIFFALLGPPD